MVEREMEIVLEDISKILGEMNPIRIVAKSAITTAGQEKLPAEDKKEQLLVEDTKQLLEDKQQQLEDTQHLIQNIESATHAIDTTSQRK